MSRAEPGRKDGPKSARTCSKPYTAFTEKVTYFCTRDDSVHYLLAYSMLFGPTLVFTPFPVGPYVGRNFPPVLNPAPKHSYQTCLYLVVNDKNKEKRKGRDGSSCHEANWCYAWQAQGRQEEHEEKIDADGYQ